MAVPVLWLWVPAAVFSAIAAVVLVLAVVAVFSHSRRQRELLAIIDRLIDLAAALRGGGRRR